MKKSLYCWHKRKFRKKYLRQPSINFHFCNISSSCDVVYKGRWLTPVINKYSVTKYFFIICFENLHLGIPSTHTYIPLICVGHDWKTKCTNLVATLIIHNLYNITIQASMHLSSRLRQSKYLGDNCIVFENFSASIGDLMAFVIHPLPPNC
jgi:hypothetical protein